MGYLLADTAYLLALLLDLAALVLALEWFLHALPGAGFNGARRALFQASFPLQEWSERFLAVRWGSFHSRGLLTAALLLGISRYALPWLVLLGFSLRG